MVKMLRRLSVGVVIILVSGQAVLAGVLSRPDVIMADDSAYPSVDTRRFQGISSMAVSPGGRLWATWYAGPTAGEDANNYVVLATSGDDGRSWTETLIVDPDGAGPLRTYDPEIWLDPQGRLWLFWAQSISYGDRAQTWAMIAEYPEDGDAVWGEPFHVAPGVMMCKPTVLKNGDWLLPISCWEARVSDSPNAASANVYVSRGQWAGECFRLHGTALVPVSERVFDEHMVVERKDGSLWMLVRVRYGIGESVSTDGGRTWSDVAPSDIPHPTARFFIRRLDSGNLLLVKHGPIDRRTGRSDLQAYISKDDGKSWQGGLMLDARSGVSYPDGQQAADGRIYITYDYSRDVEMAIFMAVFTEEDVLAGQAVSGKVQLQVPISQPDIRLADPVAPYGPAAFDLDDNADGAELKDSRRGRIANEYGAGATGRNLQVGAQVWSDRDYVFSVIPEPFEGKRYIRSSMNSSKQEIQRRGYIYVFAVPDIEDELIALGFEKTNVPQFVPFVAHDRREDFDAADAVSVFQKHCEPGEMIEYGKWGITVF